MAAAQRSSNSQQYAAPKAATGGIARAPQRRDLLAQTIGGKYLVRSVLGEGGMGTVYEAEHVALGRAVAVKVLHPSQVRKQESVKRFHQEARAAGAIGHPNICEVYDFGTLPDGSPYLVMEKLVGETLADRISCEGGLPFDDVVDILTQLLSGLVAAHEKGVIHRDIKPENIFLARRVGCPPIVKILDFGVSKMVQQNPSGESDEDMHLTRTGMVMGTPYYLSPEQARGDRDLDRRVDLWAAGIILYEALTGRRPFHAANYNALLVQILTTTPRPAREVRPALPLAYDAVISKAMARGRDDRYQSAAAFQKDLQGLRDRHRGRSGGLVGGPDSLPGALAGAYAAGTPDSAAPSSLDIPISLSIDTPLSVEAVSTAEGRRKLEAERNAVRSFRNLGLLDHEEESTQVSANPFGSHPGDATDHELPAISPPPRPTNASRLPRVEISAAEGATPPSSVPAPPPPPFPSARQLGTDRAVGKVVDSGDKRDKSDVIARPRKTQL